jgi:hypothetical protein
VGSRRHHTVVLVWTLFVGCGRLGFGDQESVDATTESGGPFVPLTLHAGGFATTSATFVDIPDAELTIPPSVGKRWLVVLAGTIESSIPLDVTVEARYLVDGVERGVGATQNTAPGYPGPWQHFILLDGTTAPQQITFQLRDAQGGTAKLVNLDVVALPLDPQDVAYANNDPVIDVTALTPTPVASLSLGALHGDYVFMLLTNMTDLPGASDVFLEWAGPNNEAWLVDHQQPREPRQSAFIVRRAPVDSDDAVVKLVSYGGSGPGQLSYSRVVALRADAFASVDFAVDETPQVTTSAALTQTVTTTVSPGAASYLFVGSMRLSETCNMVPDADRLASYDLGSMIHVAEHRTDNCAYDATYGYVTLLSTAPPAVSARVGSANGLEVQYFSSEVLMLGLR